MRREMWPCTVGALGVPKSESLQMGDLGLKLEHHGATTSRSDRSTFAGREPSTPTRSHYGPDVSVALGIAIVQVVLVDEHCLSNVAPRPPRKGADIDLWTHIIDD